MPKYIGYLRTQRLISPVKYNLVSYNGKTIYQKSVFQEGVEIDMTLLVGGLPFLTQTLPYQFCILTVQIRLIPL